MNERAKIESQLHEIRKKFDSTPKFINGKFNRNYFSLKAMIKNLEFKLSELSWDEYLSK